MKQRLIRLLLIFLVSITPIIITLIAVSLRASVSDYAPGWNDAVSNWHQILTYKEVGFEGGYYTYNERPPSVDLFHFYIYGPWFSMLYGTIAKVVGWNFGIDIAINAAFVAIALAIFCVATRLNNRQILLLGLMVGTFWCLIFFLFTMMQEAFQMVLAIGMALAFSMVLKQGNRLSRRNQWLIFGYITFAALMRVSWVIFYLPLFLLTHKLSFRNIVLSLLIAGVSTLLLLTILNYVSAPGNNTVLAITQAIRVSPRDGVYLALMYFFQNLRSYLQITEKDPLDSVQTVQMIFLILLFAIQLIPMKRRQPQPNPISRAEASFHVLNLLLIIISVLILYIIRGFGDYRVIGTHLMVTCLLLVVMQRYTLVGLLIAINILAIPLFMQTFTRLILEDHFSPRQSLIQEFHDSTAAYLIYDPQATSPWCNTLFFQVKSYEAPLLGVPAGIGLSFFSDPANSFMPQRIKSRYILLEDNMYNQLKALMTTFNLEYLATTSIGKLYLNRDADCSTS